MSDSLYDRPELYDLMAPPDPQMAGFYVDAVRAQDGPVLELACGTGRFTLPLAEAGLSVTAGDLSDEMLAVARRAATAAGVSIDFHRLDMRDFALGRQFATIIVGANSLMHLLVQDDFDRFFAAVDRHLLPGGVLAFDVYVPSAAILSRPPAARHAVARYDGPQGPVSVEETVRYDAATQVSHVEWFWSRPDAPDFWRHPLVLRQIYPLELPLLLERGGLRLMARFGDFDGTPFGPQSHRQVCIAGR